MTLLLRTIKVFAVALFRKPLPALGESVVRLRVWPNDLDLNLHLNNGRYLSLMDLGRFDMVMRTGLGRAAWHGRWRPMVAAVSIRYRRPLAPFALFELRSRLLSWDEKFFYIEQSFHQGDTLCAQAVVKALFVGPREKVSTQTVAHSIGHAGPPPPMPQALLAWRQWEELSR